MSFLEARDRGLPYGGIPYQELLSKLEETDMNETMEDLANNYNNYIRSEIIDRTLETPFLESDKTKRDSSISKSVLGLRYNGARGEYEHPQQPEMFVGFMDQDPRALDNNPRMDQYHEQIATRMPNLEVRMGHNCTDTDHQGPWTNQSLGQCRRDIQTALAYNTKVFTDERDGRPLNRNFVVEYDHNKKPLIYKDLVPSGINGITENTSGKNNTQYTTSSVPFVSTDTNFTPSYKNISNYCAGIMPGLKSCQRQISKDQISQEEFINHSSNKYYLQQESKIKMNNVDQKYQEHFNNFHNRSGGMYGKKYVANNINSTIDTYDIENLDNVPTKVNLITPVTNPTLLNNDPTFYESNVTNNKRSDLMKYSNANTYINAELQPNDIITSESTIQKHFNMYGNNNNITLVNSSYYIPEFKFKHMEVGKHANFPDNQTIITKTKYDNPYGTQDISQSRSNAFKFSDDIGKVMAYSSVIVPDTTNESQLRHNPMLSQENKLNAVNSEEVWFNSDENEVGKTQKQSRTGGIEPTNMDIKNSHDFDVSNGGSIIGKKAIRGDRYTQEVSETENINDIE